MKEYFLSEVSRYYEWFERLLRDLGDPLVEDDILQDSSFTVDWRRRQHSFRLEETSAFLRIVYGRLEETSAFL